MYNMIAIK